MKGMFPGSSMSVPVVITTMLHICIELLLYKLDSHTVPIFENHPWRLVHISVLMRNLLCVRPSERNSKQDKWSLPPTRSWNYSGKEIQPKKKKNRVNKDLMVSTEDHIKRKKQEYYQFSSVQFSRSVMSDSLRPHELQHTRPPCPSPTPGVHPNSCPSSR